MRGNITRRGKHSWRIKYDVGTDEHGKRLIQWKTVRGTKREAEQELARLLNELAEGRYVVPSAETVATYSRHWLDTVAAMSDKVSQSSLERYRTRVAAYIIPAIGDIPLQSLDGRALDKFYTYLRTKAGRRSKGLAPATVRGVHVVLSRILKSAVKSRSISRNPIEETETAPTAGRQKEVSILEEPELIALLDHLRDHFLYLPTLLAAATGMRRGEVLGLRWRDLEMAQGTLKVAQQAATIGGKVCLVRPKSARSRRTITLPASLIPELQGHKREQAAWRLRHGLGKDAADLVFTDAKGDVVDPERFTESFKYQVRRVGLGRLKFHSLRHLHITQLLQAGVPVHIVSARAGHARPSITLDLYSHVLSGDDATAAERANEALLRVLK